MEKEINLDEVLPQKYPFRMIDRVVECVPGERLTAVKLITGNEWCFEGQSHEAPHFPETLIIETAAQATLALYKLTFVKKPGNSRKFLLGKIKANDLQPCTVGDTLEVNVTATKMMVNDGFMQSVIMVQGQEHGVINTFYKVVKND